MESQKYADEDILQMRQKLDEQQENLDKLTNQKENNIEDGYVYVEGYKIPFAEWTILKRIKIKLPTKFKQMEKQYAALKYPAYRDKNIVILTNEDTSINFMFDPKNVTVQQGGIEAVRDYFCDTLLKMNPSVNLLDKTMVQTKTVEIGCFEVVTPAIDKAIYNFMYFFTIEEKLIAATFNCYDDEKKDWQPIIRQIVSKLEITKGL